MSRVTLKDTVSYRVLRQYVNRNGELFLALEFLPGEQPLELNFEETQLLRQSEDGSCYQGSGVVGCSFLKQHYMLNYTMPDGTCRIWFHPGENSWESSQPVTYCMSCLNSTEKFGWQYDTSQSLHVAYMQALCTLMANGLTFDDSLSLMDNRLIVHYPLGKLR